MAPYTDDDDATITSGVLRFLAASMTRRVPVAFTSCDCCGSAIDLGTEGRAARCTIASHPVTTLARRDSSRMEPSKKSILRPSRLRMYPVDKSSIPRTSAMEESFLTRLLPMKPAAPVIKTFMSPCYTKFRKSRIP